MKGGIMAGERGSPKKAPLAKYAFFDGRIVPFEDAKVHILTHTFNYGTGVFEGIRAYWNEKHGELYIVRLTEHLERLRANARILTLDPGYSVPELSGICIELIRKNEYRRDIYIRPIVYCSALKIGPGVNQEQALAVYAIPMGDYHDPTRPQSVMVSSWRRTDDNAIPARGKINGAYVNSSLAIMESQSAGFDDAILLNQDGHVSEGSVMNIFMKRGGTLITPPITADILEGITRADIMMLAREELGMSVEERPIDRTELYQAQELFFCGTGVKLLSIGSVDRRQVGDGTAGPVTRKLQAIYDKVVHGEDARYRNWLTPVYGAGKPRRATAAKSTPGRRPR
jgi:branched-chain amino acid aminotransferase